MKRFLKIGILTAVIVLISIAFSTNIIFGESRINRGVKSTNDLNPKLVTENDGFIYCYENNTKVQGHYRLIDGNYYYFAVNGRGIKLNVAKINEHITRISDTSGDLMYLVEGKKTAALIDGGIGVGPTHELINLITKKPLIRILTHGHGDHMGGMLDYQNIFIHKDDIETFKNFANKESRLSYLLNNSYLVSNIDKIISSDDLLPEKNIEFIPIDYGKIFDLGDLNLEVLNGKGHTPGSICILIKEDRILLTGDAVNNNTLVFDEKASYIDEYYKTVMALKSREKEWDKIIISHGKGDSSPQLLDDMLSIIKKVLATNGAGGIDSFFGENAKMAKEMDFQIYMPTDGTYANLVYNINRLYSYSNKADWVK